MNDKERAFAALLAFFCTIAAVGFVLLLAVSPARAVSQVDIDGKPHLVFDPDDQRALLQILNSKDAEIAVLRGELAKVKKGCPST